MGTSQGNSITLQKQDPVILTKTIHPYFNTVNMSRQGSPDGRKHLTLKVNTKREETKNQKKNNNNNNKKRVNQIEQEE